ncbi:MAG: DsbA family protein [Anaerolineales bacterium]
MTTSHNPEPIRMQDTEPEFAPSPMPPPTPSVTVGVAAVVFFALGFVVAGFLGIDFLDDGTENSAAVTVRESYESTLRALTPTVAPTASPAPVDVTFSETDYALGDPNAPVTFVEFSDYQCPFCGRFALTTFAQLRERYVDAGLVRFIYRDYPIFGEASIGAAQAAFCAEQQGAFWEYRDLIFASQTEQPRPNLDDDLYLDLAAELDLDNAAFSTCLARDDIEPTILQNFEDGLALLGQAGTPTFLINGQRYSGAQPLEFFTRIIDQELAEQGINPPS